MDNLPRRKSPRAPWHEYGTGLYFITIVTHNRRNYLGSITNGTFMPTKIGEFVTTTLTAPHDYGDNVRIPRFVVMPNHIHFIIYIEEITVGTCRGTSGIEAKSLLSRRINSLKGAVTRFARKNGIEFKWQTRYYDHIIRGRDDWEKIDAYICNNIANWEMDIYHQPLASIPKRQM